MLTPHPESIRSKETPASRPRRLARRLAGGVLILSLVSACTEHKNTPQAVPPQQPEPPPAISHDPANAQASPPNRQADERPALPPAPPRIHPAPSDPAPPPPSPPRAQTTEDPDALLHAMRLDFIKQFDALSPVGGTPARFLDVHMQRPTIGEVQGTSITPQDDGHRARNHTAGSCTLSFNRDLALGPALAVRFRILNDTDDRTPPVPSYGIHSGGRKNNLGIPNRNPRDPDRVHEVYLYRYDNDTIAYCYAHSTADGGRHVGPIRTHLTYDDPIRFYLATNRGAQILIEEIRAP